MIVGNRIYLRLMEKKDVPYKVKWVSDIEVRRTMFFEDISEIGTEQWLIRSVSDSTRRDYIICDSITNKPIGFASIVRIDLRNSKAETYLCIGEKEFWGRGLGKEVKLLMLEYVFNELGLNKIYSHNWSENKSMIRINESLGFKKDGCLREDVFANGEYKDRVVFSMLKSEYLENKSLNEKQRRVK